MKITIIKAGSGEEEVCELLASRGDQTATIGPLLVHYWPGTRTAQISNGLADLKALRGLARNVYVDSLKIEGLDEEPLVFGEGTLLPRGRWVFRGSPDGFSSVPNTEDDPYGRARGYGPRGEQIPDYDAPELEDLGGVEGVRARALDAYYELAAQEHMKVGPSWPMGFPHKGAAGGSRIHTALPYPCREQSLYELLASARNASRMPVACYDSETHEILTAERVADAHGGYFPHEVHLDRWDLFLPWWDDAPDWGRPSDEHDAQREKLFHYPPYDTQHAIRAYVHDRYCAQFLGDGFSAHNIALCAAHYQHEWCPRPLAPDRSYKWRDTSLYARHREALNNPSQGTGAGRDLAWVIDLAMWNEYLSCSATFAQAHAYGRLLGSYVHHVTRRDGLIQRRSYETGFKPDPHEEGLPTDHDASQMIEVSLLIVALAALHRRGYGGYRGLVEGARTVWRLWRQAPAWPPNKWVTFAPDGVTGTKSRPGGTEAFQTHAALYFAWRASRDRSLYQALLAMEDAHTAESYIRGVAKTSRYEGDRMVHAAPGVAELQEVMAEEKKAAAAAVRINTTTQEQGR